MTSHARAGHFFFIYRDDISIDDADKIADREARYLEHRVCIALLFR